MTCRLNPDITVLLQFYVSIQKVLEQLWRYFTFLKLFKCSWILHALPRVASTPSRTKTNHYWLYHLQTLNYTTPFQEGKRRSFPPLDLQKKILNSAPPLHSLINTTNKKDKMLDSSTILISFGNTSSKEMSSSTILIGLTHETNNWAVARKRWVERYSWPWDLAEPICQNIIYKNQLFLMTYHQNLTHL